MKSIVCLISGRGSNLDAILRRARSESWQETLPARVAAVISSRADAPGIHIARAAGIDAQVVDARELATDRFEDALIAAIEPHAPDVLVLAGFMRILSPGFVARYAGRLINIHPSLLPSFPGLKTHRQALAAGVRVHGATAHFVTSAVDGGPIIAQAVVPVFSADSEEELAARVLVREHELLPTVLRWYCEGKVRMIDGVVHLHDLASERLVLLP